MAFVVSYLLNTKKSQESFLRICFLIFVSYCFRNDHEVSSSPAGYAGRYCYGFCLVESVKTSMISRLFTNNQSLFQHGKKSGLHHKKLKKRITICLCK